MELLQCPAQLMFDEDVPFFEINSKPIQFANPQAGPQRGHNIIIVIVLPIFTNKLQIGLLLGLRQGCTRCRIVWKNIRDLKLEVFLRIMSSSAAISKAGLHMLWQPVIVLRLIPLSGSSI